MVSLRCEEAGQLRVLGSPEGSGTLPAPCTLKCPGTCWLPVSLPNKAQVQRPPEQLQCQKVREKQCNKRACD